MVAEGGLRQLTASQRQQWVCSHHYLTKLIDGKLFLSPIGEGVQKVVDIGTGTGKSGVTELFDLLVPPALS